MALVVYNKQGDKCWVVDKSPTLTTDQSLRIAHIVLTALTTEVTGGQYLDAAAVAVRDAVKSLLPGAGWACLAGHTDHFAFALSDVPVQHYIQCETDGLRVYVYQAAEARA